ncbi:MFS transporter [Amycolatopsis taiwanensis]|nr:MFS transporter [Amycolatopsis taiwanensis]
MFLARIPVTAFGITLTLYVVAGLGRGYGEAGLVGTATMVGTALGAPVIGRMIDRHGLRPVLTVSGLVTTAYWVSTPWLPYAVLVVVALPAGMLVAPIASIARQVIAALVPPEHRRAAYSLDSIGLEASYMIGPAVGIAVSTQLSATVALTGLGVAFALLMTILCLRNPPIRAEDDPGERPPRRAWLTTRFAATLLVAIGVLFCLAGTEVATLAALRANGEVAWTGLVIVLMCVASAAGGAVHGAVRRSLPMPVLMALLTVLVIPVGLFDHPWWLLGLALLPTNAACAPTLSSTVEEVSRLVPAGARGEAMGLLDSATRIGLAIGTPAVGFVIDHSAASWGFAASGLGGLAIAGLGLGLHRLALATAAEPATADAAKR